MLTLPIYLISMKNHKEGIIIYSGLIFLIILITSCAQSAEKIDKYLMCSSDSGCDIKNVDKETQNAGGNDYVVELYSCINKDYINSNLITKDWAVNNNVEIDDMAGQKCRCIQNMCKIVPTGAPALSK